MAVTFLTGPAGTGKTTYAVEQLRRWLTTHPPPQGILVLVPQLTLARPYRQLLLDPNLPGAGAVDVLTLNGLALKTIDLFWPLGSVSSGFGRPHSRPIFLNIEQAQYYLSQAIDPLLKAGYFDPNVVPVTISLPRLMSQILDNLNKAALTGLPHTQVGARLAAALGPESGSRVALEHMQTCVNEFRQFCLARNLLDFSLRVEMFYRHLWPVPGVRRYLTTRYRYLIVDNIEEDTPFAHTVLKEWLPHTGSALLVHDEDAGYRIFLGASPQTALSLQEPGHETIRLLEPRVAPPPIREFGQRLGQILAGQTAREQPPPAPAGKTAAHAADPRQAFIFQQTRFYPQMLDWVVGRIETLVKEGTPPAEIVVLAPFVSDALRFAFTHRMEQRGLPARSHRPSRPLSEEPAAKTMLTLARLAFPAWNLLPPPFDVAQALHQVLTGLDLVRANLLAQVVYRPYSPGRELLAAFDQIEGPARERISYRAGEQFDRLRVWLQTAQDDAAGPPVLDHFFSRLFGELLSQPGFGFHGRQEAGQIAARLINSARRFRQVAAQVPLHINPEGPVFPTVDELNRSFLEMIGQGLMAAQYLHSWAADSGDAVLITPATTFLMSNRPVDIQFWLDAGSSGWWERIAQPLTHPYVLSANWQPGRLWTDADEVAAQKERLYRLVLGLTRRCRKKIFIVNSEISEQGYEQRGQLLVALQQMLRKL